MNVFNRILMFHKHEGRFNHYRTLKGKLIINSLYTFGQLNFPLLM